MAEMSRQQYSPLKPKSESSPLESPFKVIDMNLMHELKNVMFSPPKAETENEQTSGVQDLIIVDP